MKHVIYDSNWAVEEHEGNNWNDFYDFYFDDEVGNLFKELDNNILYIADLQFWNGHTSGYKIGSRKNLNDIMYQGGNYDNMKVCVEDNDVVIYLGYHDGTHRIIARKIKNNVKINNLTNKIYNNDFTRKDITNNTTSLVKTVNGIYGW